MPSRHRSAGRGSRLPVASLFALLLAGACGCGRCALPREPLSRPGPGEFSVLTWNLHNYGLEDRDGDGQANDPKPEAERAALAGLLARLRPDVLAVQEMGNAAILNEFIFRLRALGLDYPHVAYRPRGGSESNLAILSRFPFSRRFPHPDAVYTIGEERVPVLREFLDVQIEPAPGYRFRLVEAHLKAKVFHRLGQTEMRRNEARLLGNIVRAVLREDPAANLLVVGDLNDDPLSAPLREIRGDEAPMLSDPRPVDFVGDAWTYAGAGVDVYARIDYLLVSPGMRPELVPEKTRVVRDPAAADASDHRPVLAVFRARDARGRGPRP